MDFYEDLQELDLSGKIYGVAGSGDTFYLDDYCVSVDKFAAAFEKAKATKGAEAVKINLEPEKRGYQHAQCIRKESCRKSK
jgi:flavodoxin